MNFDVKGNDLNHSWMELEKVAYFHCHLNCQHIYNNAGDIKLSLTKSCPNAACACYYLKFYEF